MPNTHIAKRKTMAEKAILGYLAETMIASLHRFSPGFSNKATLQRTEVIFRIKV